MESKKLEIIKELMEQLQDEMGYGAEDFEERLGRKKPEVKIVEMKSSESPDLEGLEEVVGEDLDGDHEEGESFAHKSRVLGGDEEMEEDCGPEENLKKRLMKLRA